MPEQEVVQNLITRLGQSQQGRMPKELDVHFADVDERTSADFLLSAKALADMVHYYRGTTAAPIDTWASFFPFTSSTVSQVLDSPAGTTPPHVALFLSFLEMYKQPQAVINRITGRHLDFYYSRVLRLTKKQAIPDKAHVTLELRPGASPIAISPAHRFSAGKDSSGVERVYAPARETVINSGKVASLRSLFVDHRAHGTVRYAPIANSSDGMGSALDEQNPKWAAFGHSALPTAEVGFAIASPVLRMKEGTREVTLTMTLSGVTPGQLEADALKGAFEAFLTGEKSWLGPFPVSPTLTQAGVMTFSITVPDSEKAVVDYNAEIHGYAYAATHPILQLLLKPDRTNIGYDDFTGVTVQKARVSVEVSNISSLTLESDQGTLDPQKAFVPFGAVPSKGARFLVGYDEALSKKLSDLTIRITWKDVPSNFATHYQHYGLRSLTNQSFTATVSFQDGGSWRHTQAGVCLFESADAAQERTLSFAPGSSSVSPGMTSGKMVYALEASGSRWGKQAAGRFVLHQPVLKAFQRVAPEPTKGSVTLSLETDFYHALYRQKYVEHVMAYSKGDTSTLVMLNEPYTPTVQNISLSYTAYSDEVSLSSATLADFANPDLHFFHISYFGQMREHGYQRAQFPFIADQTVPLLPAYEYEGEFLVGFADLHANDSISVLFQVAEGSAHPTLQQEAITWYVLCDNYWKRLDVRQVVLDTTNHLLTSGIITFLIPSEATTSNTIMPSEHIWVKGAVKQHVRAVSQMIDVVANAVEVQFSDQGNDLSHLATALPSRTIAKLKDTVTGVKSVSQPYASFGGQPAETDSHFFTRVAERLRHKDRAITLWDYERIILDAFPSIHKVKCIPHAKDGAWLSPGHVLLVVIPNLRNQNAQNPLEPKVDAITLARIQHHLRDRIGMQVKVHVTNPHYQIIRLVFKVRFHTGYEFNYYSQRLNQDLVQFLSPWAFEPKSDITFANVIHKSVVLDFIEELPYVDYVTDLKMFTGLPGSVGAADMNEIKPDRPDAILVSAKQHQITQAS